MTPCLRCVRCAAGPGLAVVQEPCRWREAVIASVRGATAICADGTVAQMNHGQNLRPGQRILLNCEGTTAGATPGHVSRLPPLGGFVFAPPQSFYSHLRPFAQTLAGNWPYADSEAGVYGQNGNVAISSQTYTRSTGLFNPDGSAWLDDSDVQGHWNLVDTRYPDRFTGALNDPGWGSNRTRLVQTSQGGNALVFTYTVTDKSLRSMVTDAVVSGGGVTTQQSTGATWTIFTGQRQVYDESAGGYVWKPVEFALGQSWLLIYRLMPGEPGYDPSAPYRPPAPGEQGNARLAWLSTASGYLVRLAQNGQPWDYERDGSRLLVNFDTLGASEISQRPLLLAHIPDPPDPQSYVWPSAGSHVYDGPGLVFESYTSGTNTATVNIQMASARTSTVNIPRGPGVAAPDPATWNNYRHWRDKGESWNISEAGYPFFSDGSSQAVIRRPGGGLTVLSATASQIVLAPQDGSPGAVVTFAQMMAWPVLAPLIGQVSRILFVLAPPAPYVPNRALVMFGRGDGVLRGAIFVALADPWRDLTGAEWQDQGKARGARYRAGGSLPTVPTALVPASPLREFIYSLDFLPGVPLVPATQRTTIPPNTLAQWTDNGWPPPEEDLYPPDRVQPGRATYTWALPDFVRADFLVLRLQLKRGTRPAVTVTGDLEALDHLLIATEHALLSADPADTPTWPADLSGIYTAWLPVFTSTRTPSAGVQVDGAKLITLGLTP